MIYYNPLNKKCKSITGGIRQHEKLELKVFGESKEPCLLVLNKDGCEAQCLTMQNTSYGWKIQIQLDEVGLYFYHFRIGGKNAGVGKFRNLEFNDKIRAYQITVYSSEYNTPDWFKGGVMYQIFPDRFNKIGEIPIEEDKILHENWLDTPEFRPNDKGKILNNDFFGGNFKGICDKLPYLKNLYISTIYLNPIFKANSNHRYDTGDFKKVDSLLGDLKDFKNLLEQARKYDIRIILDGVFNHTGDDSLYFNKYGKYDSLGAYQSKNSPYYSWYNFTDFPNKYDSWWGIDILPAVNEMSSYCDFITGDDGVLYYWMKFGLGGFRLDVADELPTAFLRKIRRAIKSVDPEGIVIGEVWEDASNKISYGERRAYFQGQELDSVMNYPLKDAIINYLQTQNTTFLRETIAMLIDNYPKQSLDCLMNILGTHDTYRILTALGGVPARNKEEMSKISLNNEQYTQAVEKLKIAAVLQFTMFGVPSIYYGDEAGMEGYSDPFCRRCFDWNNVNIDLNIHYSKLGKIRSKYSVFKDGEYNEVFADNNCIVYERRNEEQVVCVCVNLGKKSYGLKFSDKMYDLINSGNGFLKFDLQPNSYAILGNLNI